MVNNLHILLERKRIIKAQKENLFILGCSYEILDRFTEREIKLANKIRRIRWK